MQPALCLHIALSCSGIQACRLPGFKRLKPLKPSNFLAAASTKPSGRQLLLFQHCSLPALCLHIALCCWGIQASRLPAFKRLKTLKTIQPSNAHKTLTTLQLLHCFLAAAATIQPSNAQNPYNPPTAALLPRGSCYQALWLSTFAVPGLQPALCLHIPRGSFHQAPGRQRSSIAACPLPAHSPLLLGHSSLPFARLQTLKTLKTLQLPRGSFHQALWPSAFAVPALQPALCLHIALCCWGIQASRLPAFKRLKNP